MPNLQPVTRRGVLPAQAGVIPATKGHPRCAPSAPRAGGGDPHERPRHIDVTDGGDNITRADKPQQKASGVRRAGRPVPQVTPQRAANRSSYRPPEDFGFDGAPPRMGSATDDNSDIVRAFHAALGANGGGALSEDSGNYDDNAIAARAASMLRTAGRTYTLAEQRALENESHPLGARNMPTEEDLAGTHYVS